MVAKSFYSRLQQPCKTITETIAAKLSNLVGRFAHVRYL